MKYRKAIRIGIILLLCSAMIAAVYFAEWLTARSYSFEIVAQSADEIVADGVSSVKFRVRLTRGEAPVSGHTIYLFASNGSLPSSRCITDENGLITFTYYPYLYVDEKVSPLEDVTIYLQDESNFRLILVPASWNFTVKAVKPAESGEVRDWQGIEIRQEESK